MSTTIRRLIATRYVGPTAHRPSGVVCKAYSHPSRRIAYTYEPDPFQVAAETYAGTVLLDNVRKHWGPSAVIVGDLDKITLPNGDAAFIAEFYVKG